MTRTSSLVNLCFLLICCCALPSHGQTTQCAYTFNSGLGNTSLSYCVTVNGNIPQLQIPFGQSLVGAGGEGYGICDQNAQPGGIAYVDYGVSDSGNWNPSTLVSKSGGTVKISRHTSDGRWTLTQTITKVPSPPSVKIIMAVTNNQAVDDVAYLVRFVDGAWTTRTEWIATLNSALAMPVLFASEAQYGLLLQNVGTPQFGYWQGFVQVAVTTGPNPCAFAFNASSSGNFADDVGDGSIEIAYVGTVKAGKTNTATLTYRGF